jgi:hypothetical protein
MLFSCMDIPYELRMITLLAQQTRKVTKYSLQLYLHKLTMKAWF